MIDKELLKDSELFGALNDEQLDKIAALGTTQTYDTDAFVFHEHDPAASIYFLVAGRVAVLIDIGLSKRTNVFTVTKGDSFGWSAIVPPYVLTASAKCVEPSTIVSIDALKLRELLDEDQALGLKVFEKVTSLVSKRVKDTRLQLINLIHG